MIMTKCSHCGQTIRAKHRKEAKGTTTKWPPAVGQKYVGKWPPAFITKHAGSRAFRSRTISFDDYEQAMIQKHGSKEEWEKMA